MLHAYSSWRTVGEIEGKLKRGRGGGEARKVVRRGRTKREGGWLSGWWKRAGGGGGGGRCTYHPSFGRHVSVSRLVNVENRLTDPLHPRPPFATSVCPPSPSLLSPVSTTFTAPPLWSVKLFGRDRRLVISWPRLSSSGLVLTRRHSTRRIHWIRIVVEMLQILGSNLCDGLVRGATHGGGGEGGTIHRFIHKLTCCENDE